VRTKGSAVRIRLAIVISLGLLRRVPVRWWVEGVASGRMRSR